MLAHLKITCMYGYPYSSRRRTKSSPWLWLSVNSWSNVPLVWCPSKVLYFGAAVLLTRTYNKKKRKNRGSPIRVPKCWAANETSPCLNTTSPRPYPIVQAMQACVHPEDLLLLPQKGPPAHPTCCNPQCFSRLSPFQKALPVASLSLLDQWQP